MDWRNEPRPHEDSSALRQLVKHEGAAPPPAVATAGWLHDAMAWITVAILTAFYVLSYLDRTLFSLLAQSIQATVSLTDVQLSLLQGFAFTLFFGIVGIPLGWAADRFPRRWILFFGVIVWSLSSMFCGLAGSFATLFVSRAGVGVGEASLSPSAYSILGSLFDRKRLAFASGVYGTGANIGGGLALAFGGVVVAAIAKAGGLHWPLLSHLEPPWRVAFVLTGLPGILIAGLAFAVREPPRATSGAERRAQASWGAFFRFIRTEPVLLARHFASFPLVAMAVYCAAAWGPAYFIRRHHLPLEQVGYILAMATGLFGLAGNLIAGYIADQMMRRGRMDGCYHVPMVATLLAIPCGLVAFLAPGVGVATVAICLFNLTSSSFGGTAAASLNLIVPEQFRGKAFSLYWLWMGVMGGAGPLLAAVFSEHLFHDRAMVGASVAIVILLTLPVGVWMFALNRRGLHRINAAAAG
jgi:MFS family permease